MALSDYSATTTPIYPIPYVLLGGVTPVSQKILAANPQRRYFMIQNKDTTGNIWFNFFYAATTTFGVKIGPGGNAEFITDVPSYDVYVIGDIANNANVVVVEG